MWDLLHVVGIITGSKYISREAVDPTGEPIDVLLSGHVVKLPYKYLCLHPSVCAALNFDHRKFLTHTQREREMVGAQTHNQSTCQEYRVWALRHGWSIFINPLPTRLRDVPEKRMGGSGSWGVGKSHVTCCLRDMTWLLHTWAHWFVHWSGSGHRWKSCWNIKVLWRREEMMQFCTSKPSHWFQDEKRQPAKIHLPFRNELQGHTWMTNWYAGVRSAFAIFQTMHGNTEFSTFLSLFLCGILLFLSAFNTKYCDCICRVFHSNVLRSVSLWFVSNEAFSNGNKEADSYRETSSKCCLESLVVAPSSSRKSLHFVGY